MYCDEFGSGKPVLLLHGNPNPPHHLEPLARALAPSRHVLLLHLPGYGPSESPVGPPSTTALVDGIVEELQRRQVGRLSVFGFSLGGYLALALAADPRVEVSRVFALAPFVHYTDEERERVAGLAAAVRAGADLSDTVLSAILPADLARDRPDLAAEVRSWSRACSGADLAWHVEAALGAEDLVPRLRGLRLPVTLRVGDRDSVVSLEKVERVVRAMPLSELQIVPGVGHAPLLEDREATIAAVCSAFLAP
jgi:3-oxoadipate enol-lactonase